MSKKSKQKSKKRKFRRILCKKQINFHTEIKNKLNGEIHTMASEKEKYVIDPEKSFARNRKISLEDVVKLTLSMGGANLHKEIYEYYQHDPKKMPSPSALLQQKAKLKEDFYEVLFHRFNAVCSDTNRYKGYKLYAVDGTDLNVAYNENSPTYVRYKENADGGHNGYNQMHCNLLYDLTNNVFVDLVIQPKQEGNERKALISMLQRNTFEEKTVFIGDRGYPSWNLFTHFKYTENADFLIRYPNDQSALVRELPLMRLDRDEDITVTTNPQYKTEPGYYFIQTKKNVMKNREYSDTSHFTDWDFKMFEKLHLRIVRFKITEDTYETIITSLPKNLFPTSEIKKIYALRWQIETAFRELKYTMGLTHLHARREDFVKQEIFARIIMYNFCERIHSAIKVQQNKDNKYEYRINFKMGMRICVDYYRGTVRSTDFYDLIEKHLIPIRPGRSDKRKIRPKSFISFTYRVA